MTWNDDDTLCDGFKELKVRLLFNLHKYNLYPFVDVFINVPKEFEDWTYDEQRELLEKMYPNDESIWGWEFTDKKETKDGS